MTNISAFERANLPRCPIPIPKLTKFHQATRILPTPRSSSAWNRRWRRSSRRITSPDEVYRYLRALADADNVRKRAQADIAQSRKYAAERVVEDLLPVMDSLEAALGTGESDLAALRTGVEVTRKQLQAALERAGVAVLEATPGQRFDPHRHQAMAALESDQEPNTVIAVLQKGYALNERVVRPALVTVAKAKTVENGDGNPISGNNLESN